jgi:hypothetical protein
MFEVNFGLEILAMLTGLIFFRKIKPVIYRLLVPFLFISVLNEGLTQYGFYARMNWDKKVVFNFYFLLEFIVIGIIYLVVLYRHKARKQLFIFFILALIVQVVFLVAGGLSPLNPDHVSVGCAALIIFDFYYLHSIYTSEKLLNLRSNPLFWFSIGLIISQFLLLFFINAIRIDSFRKDSSSMTIFQALNTLANFIYYLCICYSFLCTFLYSRSSLRRDGT